MSRPPPAFVLPALEKAIRANAIDPSANVFLTANAGSGKTTILASRVIRLLLDGVDASKILCLTYTKAAAAEMQTRIFDQLARWVRFDDAALSREIEELTGQAPSRPALAAARALFARAVETPGGLKIQTIHAFAERLLHLFPFEANVPTRFAVMDETQKRDVQDGARRAAIRAAVAAPESALGRAFGLVAARASEAAFGELLAAALPLLRRAEREPAAEQQAGWRAAIAAALESDADATVDGAAARLVAGCGFPPPMWAAALGALEPDTTDTRRFIGFLKDLQAAEDDIARADKLADLFLKDDGEARVRLISAAMVKRHPWLLDAVEAAKAALPPLVDGVKRARACERSLAVTTLAADVLARVRAEKQRRALVDFDDMIDRAQALMTADNGASWVLRKLDGGVDHVLVDEAQDTSPEQWTIVTALTAEFFAGAGARQGRRTIFAVGDEKQSIFSFQGARPEAFDASRRLFAARVTAAQAPFTKSRLALSFRTVPDILAAVDAVFGAPARAAGLEVDGSTTVHASARAGEPGFVEIWPLEPAARAEPRDPWEEVDAPGRHAAPVTLAGRLARHVAGLIREGRFEDDGAAIRAGDVMILVRTRGPFFDAVIRALKREGVAVAGADRINLGQQIGVMDLMAAARAALMPEDDLSVAEALKSPLLGLDDEDLIALAPRRPGSLFAALAASPVPRHAAAAARLERWRGLARDETPYGFFAALLGPLGGRRALLGRLGPDAADAIDLFLAGVLEREGRSPPSLAAVAADVASLDIEIKRDQEQAGDAVRVMTVHGAKGLEARIVYLADANSLPDPNKAAKLYAGASEAAPASLALLWPGRKEEAPAPLLARRATEWSGMMDEYRRLFYVAMTRARDRLYIAGWERKKAAEASWHEMAFAALAPGAETIPFDGPAGEALRWRRTPAPPAPPAPLILAAPPAPAVPSWALRPAPAEIAAAPPLRPSRAIDAADRQATPERDRARLTGDLVHMLLERLPDAPPVARAGHAARLLAARAPRLSAAEAGRLTAQALALIAAPALAGLFGEGSLAEAAIAGTVALPSGAPRSVLGRIDRLAVTEGGVLFADYKTGAPPRELADRPDILAQMALYRAVLAQVYPARAVQGLVVWTSAGRIDSIDPALLDAALAQL